MTGNSVYKAGFAAYTYSCEYSNNYTTGNIAAAPRIFRPQWANTISECYAPDSPYSLEQMKSDDFTEELNTNAAVLATSDPVLSRGSGFPLKTEGIPGF